MSRAVSQHRIAAYNAGCTCDLCREAAREHRAKYRDANRRKRGPFPGAVMCPLCDLWFSTRGIGTHGRRCYARRDV